MQEANLNWPIWFHRWEMMQNSYISHRAERFDLMLRLPGWPRDRALRILDLGCGPGSVALRAAGHFPQAEIVAVGADPTLLRMGQAMALQRKAPIRFVQADLREPGWLEASGGEFDLALSATALHWLNQEPVKKLYDRLYAALKPGGWFINADHFASDQPETQTRYRALTQERQRLTRLNAQADDWAGFWQNLRLALGSIPPSPPDDAGSDDGWPKAFHFQALRDSGFVSVDIHWQDLGDAIMAAQKPL